MKKYVIVILWVLLLLAACGRRDAGSVTLVQESSEVNSPIYNAEWLDDTRVFIDGTSDVFVWDQSKQALVQQFHQDQGVIAALDVNAASETVAAVTDRGILTVWDINTGTTIYTGSIDPENEYDYSVTSLKLSTDGAFVVSSPYVYDPEERKITYLWNLSDDIVMSRPAGTWGTFLSDMPSILFEVSSTDQGLRALDLKTNTLLWTYAPTDTTNLRMMDGDSTSVLLCLSTECHLVASDTGIPQTMIQHNPAYVYDAYLLQEYVIIMRMDDFATEIMVDVYDRNTGEVVNQFNVDRPVTQSLGLFMNTAVSSQGQLAIAFGLGSDIYDFYVEPYDFSPVFVYDLESGEQLATLDRHTDAVNVLAFNPSGTHLFTGSSDRTFKIWEIGK